MAGEQEAAGAGGRGLVETLKHKVGPLPVGVWVAAFVVIYLVVRGRKSSSGAGGQQTDPAGNVGAIDPKTGYVYGTSQDQAALSGQSSGGGGSGSGSGSTVAGQYTTNAEWARAAINLLVGAGIDPTEANSAIEQYISSQQLTPQQHADVNFAIQALGAPPDPPQPGSGGQVVKPPSPTKVYATNPPTGLAVTGVTASAIGLKWNRSTNATGYTITATGGNQPTASTTVSGTDASGTVSGLAPNVLYTVKVQAQPARPGDGFASLTVTTNKGAAGTGGGGGPQLTEGQVINVDYNSGGQSWDQIGAKFGISGAHLASNNGQPASSKPPNVVKVPYRIGHGDTLQSVAAKFGISVQHLQEFL